MQPIYQLRISPEIKNYDNNELYNKILSKRFKGVNVSSAFKYLLVSSSKVTRFVDDLPIKDKHSELQK